MEVMERRKEIAILRTMGAMAASIALIFLWQGAAVGVIGTVLGDGSGFLTSYLVGRYHLIHLPADMFMVSNVPVELNPWNFVLVAMATIVLCMLASVYPALQAARLRPVEVIRYE
jgi:lipoprotein-releasing system permease protein